MTNLLFFMYKEHNGQLVLSSRAASEVTQRACCRESGIIVSQDKYIDVAMVPLWKYLMSAVFNSGQ